MESSAEVRVNIRSLAVGGAGVGEVIAQIGDNDELLGITAFVPGAAPGEQVRARVEKLRPRYLDAELLSVEVSSKERVTPECPHFGVCGGCELQHMSYASQVQAKYDMIKNSLQAARLDSDTISELRPLVLAKPFNYRRRLTLHLDQNGRVGFYRAKSRSIVPINSCEIGDKKFVEILSSIQSFSHAVHGLINQVVLEADSNNVIAVLKSPYGLGKKEISKVLDEARKHFENAILFSDNQEVGCFGVSFLEYSVNAGSTVHFQLPADAFSQVNWEINTSLIELVLSFSEVSKGLNVLDLYSGAGNFALPLAKAGAEVLAIELNQKLVSFGIKNAKKNSLERQVEFRTQDVAKFLQKDKTGGFDVVVADPPRAGLGGLVKYIDAKKVLLVSCHLPSMVRDTKALVEKGYEVQAIQPFDMFAQTSHLEILTVFEKF